MFFIDYINIFTLFYKFVAFSINLLLSDDGICCFLKYFAGNFAYDMKLSMTKAAVSFQKRRELCEENQSKKFLAFYICARMFKKAFEILSFFVYNMK